MDMQKLYYEKVSLFETELKCKPHLNLKDFYANIKKLEKMIANLDEAVLNSREELEETAFNCILGAWQKDYVLAKNMATEILHILPNLPRVALFLRRIILENSNPGSMGKISEGAPLVSIVTPLYNQGVYLKETVQSVLNQNYENWEMVIVNDGSTDDSLNIAKNIIEQTNDPRLRLLTHENRGKGYTRNRGVRNSNGKYICVLDSDDQLAPDYLNVAVNILEKDQGIGWVTPRTLVYGGEHRIVWDNITEDYPGIKQCISPCSAVYRKCIWEELEGYLENMTDREDWEFWIRAWEDGWHSSNSTEEVLFIYRHAFQRFGTLPEPNVNSKLEIIKMHPWWYKQLSGDELINECLQYSTGCFTDKFINNDYIAIAIRLHENKKQFTRFMSWLKKHWDKPYSQAQPEASKLRMAIHYAAIHSWGKATKYLNQLQHDTLKDWQQELVEFIRPLMA